MTTNAPWLAMAASEFVITTVARSVADPDGTQYPTKAPTTKNPTKYPTTSPTLSPTQEPTPPPTPHPCDDDSHGCDKGAGGICYKLAGNQWGCDCSNEGYECVFGCEAPHIQHRCKATRAPTMFPTPHPTSYPTAAPTRYPTGFPSTFPTAKPTASPTASPTFSEVDHPECAKTRCSYLELGNGLHRTAVYRYKDDTEKYHCEYVKGWGKNNCKCWCSPKLSCTLTHHHDAGYQNTYHWSKNTRSHC